MSGISVVDDEIIKFYNRRISKINKFKHIENVNANPDFFETPDFLDVKNVVVKCNTTYNLKLSSTQIDNMACKSFKAVSHYLQKCRAKESRVFFDSIAQEFGDNEDPAKVNQELECILKKNKEEGDKKLSEIFKMYEDKQNGLSKEELEQMQQDTGDSNSDSEEEPQNYKKLKLDDFENDHCRKQEKPKNNYKEIIDSDSEKEFVSKEKINYRKKEKQKVKEINEVTLINTDSEEEPAKIEKNKSNRQYKQKKETRKNKVIDSDSEEEPVKPFGCMPTTWSDSPIVPTSVPSNDTDDSVIILDDSVVILEDSDATPTPPRRKPPLLPKITIKPMKSYNRPGAYISNNTTPRRPHQQTRWETQPSQPGSTWQSTQYGRQRNNHNYREHHAARYNNSGRPYHNNPFRK
ncbi:unnamed protein product [Trichogramma brassicae]|uniref:Daxx histone-binding domain-containing protein n=1 Tax=Trichogramma brassicae TaxID=86971 RepID=A0A6H5J1E9_9HYME|nr:unnamed protein product [Trichogramma brassicae]